MQSDESKQSTFKSLWGNENRDEDVKRQIKINLKSDESKQTTFSLWRNWLEALQNSESSKQKFQIVMKNMKIRNEKIN